MTQQSDWNKAIAEFMDWNYPDLQKFIRDSGYHNYHESWNKLMPVVEKIESLNDENVKKVYVSINGNSCSIWNYFDVKGILREDSDLNCPFNKRHTGKTKIDAVYQAVIQFITYYNSINKIT